MVKRDQREGCCFLACKYVLYVQFLMEYVEYRYSSYLFEHRFKIFKSTKKEGVRFNDLSL